MGAEISMKAIPTEYGGVTFRSRLEARWAMFLDESNIPWKYEWEGYDLDGYKYLPDFYLPKRDAFLEIKPGSGEWLKQAMLALHTMKPVIVAEGGVVDRAVVQFYPWTRDGDTGLTRAEWRAHPCRACQHFTLRPRDDARTFCMLCGASGNWIRDVAERAERHSFWNPPKVERSVVVSAPATPVQKPDQSLLEAPSTSLRDRLRAGARGSSMNVAEAITVDQVADLWESIQFAVSQIDRWAGDLIANMQPIAMDGNQVILATKNRGETTLLEHNGYTILVEDVLSRQFGVPLTVTTMVQGK